jgi:hypothetical protein
LGADKTVGGIALPVKIPVMEIPDMLKFNYGKKWKPLWLERICAMKKLFECEKRGVVTNERSHLCVPRSVDGLSDYCGSSGDVSHMCDSIRETAEYSCVTCGRTAEKAEMICDSIKLH